MIHEPHKPDRDKDLERDLESMRAAWDRPEHDPLAGTEPPELVDMAVMNAAQRDLARDRKRRPLRWLGGFATATVVVLAIGVVLQQEPSLPEPGTLDKQGAPMAAPAATQSDEPSLLQTEQSPLPAAQPQAQAREAKRRKMELRTTIQPAAGQEEDSVSAPPSFQAEEYLAPHTARDKNTLAETASDTAEEAAAEETPRSADAWIDLMLGLKSAGETDRLAEEITAFRRYYPDHVLPDDLLADTP
jgi:hypothetical protein